MLDKNSEKKMLVAQNSLKIAIVVNTAWNIVNFRLGLVKALVAAGHQVLAIAPPDEHVPTIEAAGATFIPLKRLQRKGTNPLKDMRLTQELYRVYKNNNIDVALQYTIKPNIYGTFAARMARVKTICTVTGLGYSFISTGLVSRIAKGLYRQAFKQATRIAFQNRDDQQLFIDKKLAKKEKTMLIKGSGINTEHFCPGPKLTDTDEFVFLFVGRLLFDKGIRELLQAAEDIKKSFPKAAFWVVGAIDKDNPSCIDASLIEDYQKKGIVRYLGVSNKVKDIVQDCDVVVLPSYREGLPRVMLEALSMAKPVITTDTAGCRETVLHGENGYMVPVKDAHKLEEAMRKMLEHDAQELEEMGQKGRAMALQEFDEKIIIQQYFNILNDLFPN